MWFDRQCLQQERTYFTLNIHFRSNGVLCIWRSSQQWKHVLSWVLRWLQMCSYMTKDEILRWIWSILWYRFSRSNETDAVFYPDLHEITVRSDFWQDGIKCTVFLLSYNQCCSFYVQKKLIVSFEFESLLTHVCRTMYLIKIDQTDRILVVCKKLLGEVHQEIIQSFVYHLGKLLSVWWVAKIRWISIGISLDI